MFTKNAWMTAAILAAVGAAVSTASAQVAINELWENPPQNGAEESLEYIEIYGPPNYNLTGYSVCLIKGVNGSVANTEIDEAFTLDGLSTDANGFLFIHNSDLFATSDLRHMADPSIVLPPCPNGGNPCWNNGAVASKTNRRFSNGVAFRVVHIPSLDTAGKLGNDDSSTYLLTRRRPLHGLNTPAGTSFYATGYSWGKDYSPDIDTNSRLDYGTFPAGSRQMQAVQIVDELAWSNNSGYEYNLSGRGAMSNKISDTPGFNPDGASRVRYLGAHPGLPGETLADESWVRGEHIGGLPSDPIYPVYMHLPQGEDESSGAPTNPLTGQPFSAQGFRMTPGGFNDAPAGAAMANVVYSLQTTGAGAGVGKQFRWVRGDFNFDGLVNCDDRALIVEAAAAGWGLDETTMVTDNNNTAENPADDIVYTGFARQVENFNGVLAMIRMNLADGSTGEWTSSQVVDIVPGSPTNGKVIAWGGVVTASDLSQFDSEFPGLCVTTPTGACCLSVSSCEVRSEADCEAANGTYKGDGSVCASVNCCPADFNVSGTVDVADLFAYINAWLAKTPNANFNGDGAVDVADLFAYINAWLAKC